MTPSIDESFISATSYRGYIIQQKEDGYYVAGIKRGDTIEQAHQAIDAKFQDFANSMRRPARLSNCLTSKSQVYANN